MSGFVLLWEGHALPLCLHAAAAAHVPLHDRAACATACPAACAACIAACAACIVACAAACVA